MEGAGEDPRPPWVYVGARVLSFVLIPGAYSRASCLECAFPMTIIRVQVSQLILSCSTTLVTANMSSSRFVLRPVNLLFPSLLKSTLYVAG